MAGVAEVMEPKLNSSVLAVVLPEVVLSLEGDSVK